MNGLYTLLIIHKVIWGGAELGLLSQGVSLGDCLLAPAYPLALISI